MVDQKQDAQDLMARLADLSEGAIQRLSEAPGAESVMSALKGLGERVDELAAADARLRGDREAAVDAREAGRLAGEAEAGAEAEAGVSCPPAEERPEAEEALTARPRRRRQLRPSQGAARRRGRWACGSRRARAARRRLRARSRAGAGGAARRRRARPRRARSAARDRSARTSRTRRGARRPGRAAVASTCGGTRARPRRRPSHAAVQHTAASARPRFQSCHAATSTSRSEKTACPGSVTIWVTPTPTGWSGACSSGTIPSSVVGAADGVPASGIAWSTAH